uniref:Uncharacterized protein n=1 Tax=Rhizophora mucronata TaxID=61149 RepID=A0A2P2MHK4_RHIMU
MGQSANLCSRFSISWSVLSFGSFFFGLLTVPLKDPLNNFASYHFRTNFLCNLHSIW